MFQRAAMPTISKVGSWILIRSCLRGSFWSIGGSKSGEKLKIGTGFESGSASNWKAGMIRIRFRAKRRIRIRIKVKSRIRIRIKVKTGSGSATLMPTRQARQQRPARKTNKLKIHHKYFVINSTFTSIIRSGYGISIRNSADLDVHI